LHHTQLDRRGRTRQPGLSGNHLCDLTDPGGPDRLVGLAAGAQAGERAAVDNGDQGTRLQLAHQQPRRVGTDVDAGASHGGQLAMMGADGA